MTALSVRTKGTQRGGAQYNRGPPRRGPKRSGVWYYCGKAGHWVRECKLKQAHELTRMPQQTNHTQAALYNSVYADQYQVSWINKRDEIFFIINNNNKNALGCPQSDVSPDAQSMICFYFSN